MKQNLIRTMELIGRSLHPDHLKQKQFVFHKRVDLINHLLVSCGGVVLSSQYHPDNDTCMGAEIGHISSLNNRIK